MGRGGASEDLGRVNGGRIVIPSICEFAAISAAAVFGFVGFFFLEQVRVDERADELAATDREHAGSVRPRSYAPEDPYR